MKKYIKSYLVFVPALYRIMMLGAVPLVLTISYGVLLAGRISEPGAVQILVFGVGTVYLYAEIVMEAMVFGGIACKSAGQPEYLKSSPRGPQLLKNAFITAAVKPFVFMSLIVVLGTGIAVLAKVGFGREQGNIAQICRSLFTAKNLGMVLLLLLAANALITLCSIANRFAEQKFVGWCLAALAAFAYTALAFHAREQLLWALLLSIPATAAFAVLAVKITLKKMKESYYDKRDK